MFSSAGMNTRTITVGTQKVINGTLAETTAEIKSVVVVGYSVLKKETVDGAVSQIPGERLTDIKTGGAPMGSNSPLIFTDRYHKVIYRA